MQKFSVYHSDQLKGRIFAYSTGESKKDKPMRQLKTVLEFGIFLVMLIIWVQKLFGIQISHLLDPELKSQKMKAVRIYTIFLRIVSSLK